MTARVTSPLFLICALVWHGAATADAFSPLALICGGAGSSARPSGAVALGSDGSSVAAYGSAQQGFRDQVRVEISAPGSGRLQVPRSMLPPLHGGDEGWFEIKKLAVNPTEITGRIELAFLKSASLRIDRLTGFMKLDSQNGTYAAECERFDPETAAPRF